MPVKLSAAAGVLSVVVFLSLAGFLAYDAVTGQAAAEPTPSPEVTRAPGPHPLDGFGPEDLPATEVVGGGEVVYRSLLDGVTVDCSSGTPQLQLQAREMLPRGATIEISAHSAGTLRASGLRSYPRIGEPQLVSLAEAADRPVIDVSPAILTLLVGPDAEHLSVRVIFDEPDGAAVSSNIVQLSPAAVRCDSGA